MEAAELWKGCTIPRREAVVAGTKEEAMEEGKHFDLG